MAGLTVRVIETFPEFLALKEKWDALVEAMELPHPNVTHTWIRCWWETLGQKERIHIITVWEGEDLVAALPLKRQTDRFLKIFHFSCLNSINRSEFPVFNVICRAPDRDRALASVRDHLIAESRSWEVMVLTGVPLSSGAVDALERGFCCHGLRVFLEPVGKSYETHVIDIQGEFETFFKGLNKNFRHVRRNNNNLLTRKGRVEFEVIRAPDPAALECFYDLEHNGWKGEAGTSIRASPGAKDLYDRIAREFSQKGQFLLATLRVNGQAIASGFGLVFHNTFYFLKMGVDSFSPEYRNVSPGQALIFHLIKFCFAEKITTFDFYGPCYPYQAHWTKAVHRKKTVVVFNTRYPLVKVCACLKSVINFIRSLGHKAGASPCC